MNVKLLCIGPNVEKIRSAATLANSRMLLIVPSLVLKRRCEHWVAASLTREGHIIAKRIRFDLYPCVIHNEKVSNFHAMCRAA